MFRYFSIFILLTLFGYLYDKYKLKQEDADELDKYNAMEKFLLNNNSLLSGKPILWIHNTYEENARIVAELFLSKHKKIKSTLFAIMYRKYCEKMW